MDRVPSIEIKYMPFTTAMNEFQTIQLPHLSFPWESIAGSPRI